eukprot:g16150.t1
MSSTTNVTVPLLMISIIFGVVCGIPAMRCAIARFVMPALERRGRSINMAMNDAQENARQKAAARYLASHGRTPAANGGVKHVDPP